MQKQSLINKYHGMLVHERRDIVPAKEKLQTVGWSENEFRSNRRKRLERFEIQNPEVVRAYNRMKSS